MRRNVTGGCLCGAVTYKVQGLLRPVVACHCNQCRKTSGHYVAATQCAQHDIQISSVHLTWFRSSEHAERGFCAVCGSNLFWRRLRSTMISVFAGTIEGNTGLTLSSQLYPEESGDYYELPNVPIVKQSKLKDPSRDV